MAFNCKKRLYVKDLNDRKSRSKTTGVVTVPIDNNARQPSIISLRKKINNTMSDLEYKTIEIKQAKNVEQLTFHSSLLQFPLK